MPFDVISDPYILTLLFTSGKEAIAKFLSVHKSIVG